MEKLLEIWHTSIGKLIACLLAVALAFMGWNVAMIMGAFGNDEEETPEATEVAEESGDESSVVDLGDGEKEEAEEPAPAVDEDADQDAGQDAEPAAAPEDEKPAVKTTVTMTLKGVDHAVVYVAGKKVGSETVDVDANKSVTVTVAPKSGYEIESVEADGATKTDVDSAVAAELGDDAAKNAEAVKVAVAEDDVVVNVHTKAVEETAATEVDESEAAEPEDEDDAAAEADESDDESAGSLDDDGDIFLEDATSVYANVESPAYTGYAKIGGTFGFGGITVKVTAGENVVPEGTTVKASLVENQVYLDAVKAATHHEITDSVAIDVTLYDEDGFEVQPDGAVNVCFFNNGVEGEDLEVHRVSDDASTVSAVAVREASASVASFDVDHFSIYVVSAAGAQIEASSASNSYTVAAGDILALNTPVADGCAWSISSNGGYNWSYAASEGSPRTAGSATLYVDDEAGSSTYGFGKSTMAAVKIADNAAEGTTFVVRYGKGSSYSFFYIKVSGKLSTGSAQQAFFYLQRVGTSAADTNSTDKSVWVYCGIGTVIGLPAASHSERSYPVAGHIESYPTSYPVMYDEAGNAYTYDSTGSHAVGTYNITWNKIGDAYGANIGGNTNVVNSNYGCYHVDGTVSLNKVTKVTVDFEVQQLDGTLKSVKHIEVAKGSDVGAPTVNAGSGNTFYGWYLDETFQTEASDSDFKSIQENKTFYGLIAPQGNYVVKYQDLFHGNKNKEVVKSYSYRDPAAKALTAEQILAEDPWTEISSGAQRIVGWTTSATSTYKGKTVSVNNVLNGKDEYNTIVNAGNYVAFGSQLEKKNQVLYPIWMKSSGAETLFFDITYAKGSVSAWSNYPENRVDIGEGSTQQVSSLVPASDEGVFEEWKTASITDKTSFNPGGTFTMPANDVEFVAQWGKIKVEKSITAVNGEAYVAGSSVSEGDKVSYAIKVTNTGDVTLSSVAISDALVSSTSISVGTLAAGASDTKVVTYTVAKSDVLAGSVTNTATAEGTTPKMKKVSASDSAEVPVTNDRTISVTKKWSDEKTHESVVVDVMSGAAAVANLTLGSSNNWKASASLPKYDAAGKEINYTVKEHAVTGYSSAVTGTMSSGFVVTNTAKTVDYVIKYLLNETDVEIADPASKKGTYGEQVTAEVPEISQYTAVPGQTPSATLAESGNVIKIYYYKNVALNAKSAGPITYDGKSHEVSGYTIAGERTDYSADFTGKVTEPSASGVDADTYKSEFGEVVGTVDVTKKYIVAEANNGTLVISKRDVTFAGKSNRTVYTGAEQSVEGFDATGLVEGQTSNVEAVAKGTEVDIYPGTITKAADVVIKAGADDVTKNYEITTTPGTLEIYKAGNFTISLADDTYTYDGMAKHNTKKASATAKTGTTTYEYSMDGGAFVSDLTSLERTDAGTYTISVRATNPNYSEPATTTAKLVINKRSVTFTGNSDTKVYSGKEQSVTGFKAEGLVEGQTSNVEASAKGTEVDVYTGTITAAADVVIKAGQEDVTKNYNVTTKPGKLTITQSGAEWSVSLADDKYTYDGTAKAIVNSPTTTAKSGETSYVFKLGTSTSTSLGELTKIDAGEYTVEVTATNPNYSRTATTTAKLTIEKRAVTFTGKSDTKVYTGSEQSVEGFDAAGLVEGHSASVEAIAKGTEVDVHPGTITPKSGVVIKDAEQNVVTGNYSITTTPGALTITQSAAEWSISLADDTYTYDGTAKYNAKTPSSTATSGTTTYSYKLGDATSSDLSKLTKVDAGEYTVEVTATNPNYSKAATTTAKLIIEKRAVTFTGKSDTKTYTGAEQSVEGFDATGLVKGHTSNVEAIAKGTEVDVYTGTITAADKVVIKAAGTDVTKNYNVTTKPGTLTITSSDAKWSVNLADDEYIYDGTAKCNTKVPSNTAASGKTSYSYKLGEDESTDLSKLTKVDAGEYVITVTATNPNYKDPAIATAKLTIKKRPVSFTGETDSKTYTGSQIELTGVTVGGDKLVAGHEANVSYSAKGTEVGGYDGTITAASDVVIKAGDDVVTSNYDITTVPGKLTITQSSADWSISLEDDKYTYDGTAKHNAKTPSSTAISGKTSYSYKLGEDENADLSKLTKVDAGEYTVEVTATNPNYSKVATTKAKLTIEKRTVTFTGETASRIYTGSEIELTGVTVGGDKLVEGHTSNVAYSAKGTEVGEYDGAITAAGKVTIKAGGTDVTKNYDVTTVPGKLTITQSAADWSVSLEDDTYTYDGTAKHNTKIATTNAKSGETSYSYKLGEDENADLSKLTKVDAGEYTVEVTATNPNYSKAATTTAKLIIEKRSVTFTGKSARVQYTGAEQSVKGFDAEGLVEGQASNVEAAAKGTEVDVYTGTITKAADVVIKAAGDDVTKNYNVTTKPGTLEIYKAGNFTISLDDDTYTYDGTAKHNAKKAESSAVTGTTTYKYSFDNVEYVDSLSELTKVDAGEYAIYVKATNPNYEDPATTTAKLVINKRTVTFTGKSDRKVYNGKEQSVTGFDAEGMVEGQTSNVEAVAKGTEVDVYTGTITAKGDVVIKAGSDDVTKNYDVTTAPGKLTIIQSDAEWDISLADDTYTYDATPKHNTKTPVSGAASGTTSYIYQLGDKVSENLSELTKVDAGIYTIKVTGTNPNYSKTSTTTAKLTIKKRPVSFTGETDSKTYTGSQIELTGVTVGGDKLVTGHEANVSYSAKGTEVGGYDGTITAADKVVITAGQENVTKNYDVTTAPGKLTITKSDAEWSVTLADDRYTYDGTAKYNANEPSSTALTGKTSYSYKLGEDENADLSKLTKVDAGEYAIAVTATNPNYSKAATTTAKLTIEKRAVSFTGESDRRQYTGSEIELTGVTVGGDKLVEGHTSNVAYSAKGTEVDIYAGTITAADKVVIKDGGTDVTKNYDVTTAPGTLEIYKAGNFTISLDDDTYTYDGTAKHNAKKAESTAKTGTTTYEYSMDGGAFVADLASLERTDAGTYAIAVRATNPNYEDPATTTANLTIEKRAVTFTGKSDTKVYSGEEQSVEGFDAEGLVEGQTSNVEATAKGTEADVYDGTITAKGDVVIKAGSDDVTKNYDVTTAPGKLTITQSDAEWSVSLADDKYTYDGTAKCNANEPSSTALTGTTAYTYKLGDATSADLSKLTKVDAGEYTVEVTATNPNYSKVATTTAKLTIAKRTASVVGYGWDNPQPYTGTEYVTTKTQFTGIVEGQQATITYKLAGTKPGTYEGTFGDDFKVVDKDGNDVTANYDLTAKTPGALEILELEPGTTPTPTPTPTPDPDNPDPKGGTSTTSTTGNTSNTNNAAAGPAAPSAPTPATPSETVNPDDNPLAPNDQACWIHWLMALGIAMTAVYGIGVIGRRRKFANDIEGYIKAVSGAEKEE